jgi:hypothetical protein
VAVLRGHKPIAAISVTGPTERISGAHEQFLMRSLRDCLTPHLPMGLTLQIPNERTRAPQKAVSCAVLSH